MQHSAEIDKTVGGVGVEAVPVFETSAETGKIDAALAKAQAEITAAPKDSVNPHYNSKYADLASVWSACRSALTKNGVNVTQWPLHSTDGRLHILTRLACQGEWIKGHFSIPVGKADAHGYGSATTYAKRFSLAAAVGVVADEDDDGNEAVKGVPAQVKTAAPAAVPPKPTMTARQWTDQAIKELKAMTDQQQVVEWQNGHTADLDRLAQKSAADHTRLFDALNERLDALRPQAAE